jgi:dihydropteroate synthase
MKTLHKSGPLHHARGGAAADEINVISLRLVLGEHPSCDILRVAAEEIELDEGILFFETLFERPYDLIDNQSSVKGNFPFLFGACDEKFLALGGFYQGNVFDRRAPRSMRERSRA